MTIRDDDGPATLDAAADEWLAARTRLQVSLILLHRGQLRLVALRPNLPLTIGRDPEATIRVADNTLSRRHAMFTLDKEKVWVEDLGSTNGTLVNGNRIRRWMLGQDDRVTMGSVTASIHVVRPGQETGLGLHDQFLVALDRAVHDARRAGPAHVVAALVARTPGRDIRQVRQWCRKIRYNLPSGAEIALYSPDTIEVLVPGITEEQLNQLVTALRGARWPGRGTVLWGIATFPSAVRSPEDLHAEALAAVRQATVEEPVRWALRRDLGLEPGEPGKEEPLVASPAMEEVYATARKVARADISVLLVGETGVGKEVVARTIHGLSKRRAAPMICINCGAVTETLVESRFFGHEKGSFTGADRQAKGVFEEADGGTLLLDEIGELSATAQTTLLRVLETKRIKRVGGVRPIEVDVRVLAATNRDLEAMCEAGSFREDLLFRLNVVTLEIPPLRERAEEVEALASLFLRRANEANGCEVSGFSPEVAALLQQYPWPGNVRELRNVVEHAVVIASLGAIRLEHLSDRLVRWARTARPKARARRVATVQVPVVTSVQHLEVEQDSFKELIQRVEDALIGEALRLTGWNKAAAARRLQMPLRTLKDKVRARNIAQETHDPDRAARTIAGLREKVPEVEADGGGDFKQSIERYEAALIQEALRASNGNKSQAARALQMPLQTLKNKLRRYAVDG